MNMELWGCISSSTTLCWFVSTLAERIKDKCTNLCFSLSLIPLQIWKKIKKRLKNWKNKKTVDLVCPLKSICIVAPPRLLRHHNLHLILPPPLSIRLLHHISSAASTSSSPRPIWRWQLGSSSSLCRRRPRQCRSQKSGLKNLASNIGWWKTMKTIPWPLLSKSLFLSLFLSSVLSSVFSSCPCFCPCSYPCPCSCPCSCLQFILFTATNGLMVNMVNVSYHVMF